MQQLSTEDFTLLPNDILEDTSEDVVQDGAPDVEQDIAQCPSHDTIQETTKLVVDPVEGRQNFNEAYELRKSLYTLKVSQGRIHFHTTDIIREYRLHFETSLRFLVGCSRTRYW